MEVGFPFQIQGEPGGGFRAAALSAAFLLLVVPLVGRCLLAWFPPGLPGRHGPRDLPATWAASFLVGVTWWAASRAAVPAELAPYFALAVPALALLARIATLPAGLVPRHEPVPPSTSGVARAAIVLAVVAAGTFSATSGSSRPDVFVGAAGLASAILAHEALVLARVAQSVRVVALAAVVAAIGWIAGPAADSERMAALGACGAAAGTVGWIRRGDRRALALASVAIAWMASIRGVGAHLAIPAAFMLVYCSAKPSRLRAFAWVASGWLAGVLIQSFGPPRADADFARGPAAPYVELALVALVAATAVAGTVLRIRRARPTRNPSGAPEAVEAFALGGAALYALLRAASVVWLARPDSPAAYVPPTSAPFWILATLAAAILLARGLEREPRTS